MVRRRLFGVPSSALTLLALGLLGQQASAAANPSSGFGSKPVQILAPTDAARTALKPVEEGLRALESLQVHALVLGWLVGLVVAGVDPCRPPRMCTY